MKRPTVHVSPLWTQNNKWARNNIKKAEASAKHLELTYSTGTDEINSDNLTEENFEEEIELVSPKEIEENCNVRKAPGYNLITSVVLKLLRKGLVKQFYFPLNIISKVFEKILLQRLKPIIANKVWIPSHQFRFQNGYTTIE